MGDLVGLLAGGGIATVTGFVWLVIWWARADRVDRADAVRELRAELDQVEDDHRAERIRLQQVIDAEQAGRRSALEEAARLRRMVRELGGDPG